jgi:hypothetical protein
MELVTPTRSRRLKRTVLAIGTILVVALAAEVRYIYFGRNWHEVVPGRVYRCAQLSEADLAEQIEQGGIRTIVNLRGTCMGFDWYNTECRTTSRLGVSQEDITLSATRLPAPDELRRFVEVIERSDFPIAMHCRQGVDRTGMMAATAQLLLTDATPDDARRQLGPRFGHVPFGLTRVMTRFLELYDEWLVDRGVSHSRQAFRHWACHEYCPDLCRGEVTLLDRPQKVPMGQPFALRVRAVNRSVKTWHLKPGTESGVHIRFMVFQNDGKLLQLGRTGQFEHSVDPEDSVDLTLAIASLHQPGQYHLLIDLQDRNRWAFSQFGCDPIEYTFEVTSP